MTFRVLSVPELERQSSGTVAIEGAPPRAEVVFETAEQWMAFFAGREAPVPPKVNFSQKRVVGIFLGPSGPGHAIRIDRARYVMDESRTVVEYTVILPNPNRIYPTVIVYPSIVAEIDRRAGQVVFVRREIVGND